MRAVLDTNVIVSALFFGGTPRKVYDFIGAGMTPCFTQDTFAELADVINHPKFKQERSRIPFSTSDFLERLRAEAMVVEAETSVRRVSSDPSDDMFLACALASGAECIVSGNEHLLSIGNFSGIPILTPRQFLNRVRRA